MSSVLDRAKSHYAELPVGKILVPEWGEKGKPLIVTWRPLTVGRRRRIHRNLDGTPIDGPQILVNAVMREALDEKGKNLFTEMDERALTTEVDGDVVARIGAAILGIDGSGNQKSLDDEVDTEKNV